MPSKKPNKSNRLNEPCFCGSKKKFKQCCNLKFINFTPSYLKLWADLVNEVPSGDGFEIFKVQYSKFLTSFYVELINKGTQHIGLLVSKYNDLWQEYCEALTNKFPEIETYFIKHVSKNLNAELSSETST